MLRSGEKSFGLIGTYIKSNARVIRDYETTLAEIQNSARSMTEQNMKYMILGDLNTSLHRVADTRFDLLMGTTSAENARRTAITAALSSLGVEDTGRRFLQRHQTGLWTWSQIRKNKRIRSICDYILVDPRQRILRHRIRWQLCNTDHRVLYVDLPSGNLRHHKNILQRLRQWPLQKPPISEVDHKMAILKAEIPDTNRRRLPVEWIKQDTWDAIGRDKDSEII